jgi:hypothetical protein
MQNLNLTWTQDLGSVTELLSGKFFQPLGRSSSHQLWSSAMIISPLVRGLFGLTWDAAKKTMTVNPQLPADWDRAKLNHIQLSDIDASLEMQRVGAELRIQAAPPSVCLSTASSQQKICSHSLSIPLPPVELAVHAHLPEPGDITRQLKALDERWTEHSATFTFEAQAGELYHLFARLNRLNIKIDGAEIAAGKLNLQFPSGHGYVRKTVTFKW